MAFNDIRSKVNNDMENLRIIFPNAAAYHNDDDNHNKGDHDHDHTRDEGHDHGNDDENAAIDDSVGDDHGTINDRFISSDDKGNEIMMVRMK